MRNANKRTVLGLIYQRDTISRADISRTTGLNRATVSSLVDELISGQFVRELGTGTSSGGRKPIILQFNAETGYLIGVDVQITHLTTVLINARRQVLFEKRRDIELETQPLGQKQLTDIILEEIAATKQQCPPSPHGLMGVGVGLPGMVNHNKGHALYLPNLGIMDWNLKESLSFHETLPIFIDNDANCGAWSQYLTTRAPNQLFINAGIGIGVGIIINGQLYRGAHGIAGEAGHHAISSTGDDCHCGSVGCWEQYASERALARLLAEEGISIALPLPAHFMAEATQKAQSGNPNYLNAFGRLAEKLSVGLVNLLNIFNPSVIYIGGTIAEASPLVMPKIERLIAAQALMSNRRTTILPAAADSVALGAAGLALAQTIDLLPTIL